MSFNGLQTTIKNLFQKLFKKKKETDFYPNMFPAFTAITPSLISGNLISAQPMNAPSGLLHHFEFRRINENAATREILVEKITKDASVFRPPGIYVREDILFQMDLQQHFGINLDI